MINNLSKPFLRIVGNRIWTSMCRLSRISLDCSEIWFQELRMKFCPIRHICNRAAYAYRRMSWMATWFLHSDCPNLWPYNSPAFHIFLNSTLIVNFSSPTLTLFATLSHGYTQHKPHHTIHTPHSAHPRLHQHRHFIHMDPLPYWSTEREAVDKAPKAAPSLTKITDNTRLPTLHYKIYYRSLILQA